MWREGQYREGQCGERDNIEKGSVDRDNIEKGSVEGTI